MGTMVTTAGIVSSLMAYIPMMYGTAGPADNSPYREAFTTIHNFVHRFWSFFWVVTICHVAMDQ